MAANPKAEAALALHRFGLGPRAGSIAAVASDPRGALLAELDRAGAGRIRHGGLLEDGHGARRPIALPEGEGGGRQAERPRQTGKPAGRRRSAAAEKESARHAAGTGAEAQPRSRRPEADLPLQAK